MRLLTKKRIKQFTFFSMSVLVTATAIAQTKINDVTTPLHLLQPDYKIFDRVFLNDSRQFPPFIDVLIFTVVEPGAVRSFGGFRQ